jgi:glycosyltransferase involved in cell wall biosynthesis
MYDKDSRIKRVILFCGTLVAVGGGERLLFEEVNYLEKVGTVTHVLTFNFNKDVLFNSAYNIKLEHWGHRIDSKKILLWFIQQLYNIHILRKRIKDIKPDIIISATAGDCTSLYLATLFSPFDYVTHIHGTIFWFQDDLLKYAWIHRKVFDEIRESVIGHKEFIPIKPPKSSLAMRIIKEFAAVAIYMAVRKAKKIFVLSNQMRWEVKKLYGKDAIVLKGAFPSAILNYKPKRDIKEQLGLIDKRIILDVNRLDPRKRVDLLIKSFKQVYGKFTDLMLVIGGVGPEEESLKALVKELDIQDKVKFVGYIKEEELWDYLASCDVFVHPNWADFAIAAYEPLALQKKVVWSTEMEIDEHLTGNKHIFAANPTVDDFAHAIVKALTTEVQEENNLAMYSWERYGASIMKELKRLIARETKS